MRYLQITLWLAIGGFALVAFRESYSSQPPPGHTGAPGEPHNCSHCHGGGTGTPIINLTHGGQPINTYTPGGGPITLTLSVSHPTASRYGFQLTALSSQSGQQNAPNQTLSTAGHLGVVLQTGAGGRKYVAHSPATSTGSWTFTWTPPSSAIGDITWYVATVCANGNNATSGDVVGVATFTMQPGTPSNVEDADVSPLYWLQGAQLHFSPQVKKAKLYSISGQEIAAWKEGDSPLVVPESGGGILLLQLQLSTHEVVKRVFLASLR
ncbi:MAG: choice-of-anchor V domain-containing protein [Bacteroidia bacterium]|nr:hypothetical protein [Bacteroidia bacterium]MDW8133554.1 choice-of-anchor V domain-containing protein [Bacteroidia bacterium]